MWAFASGASSLGLGVAPIVLTDALRAWSRAMIVTDVIGAMSLAVHRNETLRSAVRASAETAGGVASYARGTVVLTSLPALSTQVPPRLVSAVAGPA